MQKSNIPSSLRYVQIIRLFFLTVGAWPTELFERRSRRKVITTLVMIIFLILVIGEVTYLFQNFRVLTFIDLVDLLLTLFVCTLTFGISIVLPAFHSYGLLIKDYITIWNLNNFKNRGGNYEKMFVKVNKISHYITIIIIPFTIISLVVFNLVPFYNNYMNGVFSKNTTKNYTLQFSIYYQYPWYNQEDHIVTTTLLNYYFSYSCGIYACGTDLLMTLMALQIIGHIKVLRYNLRALPKPKRAIPFELLHRETNTQLNLFVELYNGHENIVITKKIVDFVNHHRLIVSFSEAVSRVFGPLLALFYLYDLISCAFLLLVCSQLQPYMITRFGPIAIITFTQLIQISFTFEVIRAESDKLRDEIYNTSWECMNIKNQKLIWVFYNRAQYPIRVTALGMVEVGVQAMVSILKTTLSYLALLRSIGD